MKHKQEILKRIAFCKKHYKQKDLQRAAILGCKKPKPDYEIMPHIEKAFKVWEKKRLKHGWAWVDGRHDTNEYWCLYYDVPRLMFLGKRIS